MTADAHLTPWSWAGFPQATSFKVLTRKQPNMLMLVHLVVVFAKEYTVCYIKSYKIKFLGIIFSDVSLDQNDVNLNEII